MIGSVTLSSVGYLDGQQHQLCDFHKWGVIGSVTSIQLHVSGLSPYGIVAVIYPISGLLAKTDMSLSQFCGIIAVIHENT